MKSQFKTCRWIKPHLINLILALFLLWATQPAVAQQEQPDGPVYIIQAGDTLGEIARRFGVPIDELIEANGITNPNLLSEGAQLVIPGLEGIQGVLTTVTVPFGETLYSLSRRYQIALSQLARLNHLTSPAELYAGANLVIPQSSGSPAKTQRASLSSAASILELAVLHGTNPWSILQSNGLSTTWSILPGDVFLLPGDGEAGPGGLPQEVEAVDIQPLPLGQGKTGVIKIAAAEGQSFEGEFMDRPLHFFPDKDGSYVALFGVHALAEPGFYPLTLRGTLSPDKSFAFSQAVGVAPSDYPFDQPLTVDPATIDPAVTRPEDAEWSALAVPATPQRMWQGVFHIPSPLEQDYCVESGECWTSRFGNRRSYNGSPYAYFHTGLDIAGGTGTEIYAPAPGVVVFAGPLTVRGNATMIDHGWGVYTGYMHQSEIFVQVGDRVETGDLIGLVGGTGRVEGPHLHLEVWVGGVQVDPLDWLEQTYP
jgi:murein DD-endopeptidase MepM/ murein hydrolase activator NlpD